MLKENQKVKISCRGDRKKEYYSSKGYEIGKEIYVDVRDLMSNSSAKVYAICDYCGNEFSVIYRNYYRSVENCEIKKCACRNCQAKKQMELFLLKYGVDNPMKLKRNVDKARNTLISKYGVDNPMKVEEIHKKQQESCYKNNGFISPFSNIYVQEKAVNTRKEKYGVEYIMQSDFFKEKSKKSIMEKYGVESPFQSDIIRGKINNMLIDKYGAKSPLVDDEVLSKASLSRFLNGTCITSDEQIRLSVLFNGILNFPIGRYNADILLSDGVVLEYDGGGHCLGMKLSNIPEDDFIKHEILRRKYIISKGYKMINFVNPKDKKYSDEYYISVMEKCVHLLKENNYVEFDLFSGKIYTTTYCD